MRNEFYQRIWDALGGPLDDKEFEDCACDLLRSTYPGLVPISGGNDAGMDGAIADGLGEPFPLVCTTGRKVLDNLTHSLESYLTRGGKRRKVVFTTSQDLTPATERNLYDRARELGFTLINTHDRADIAQKLYRAPDWCRSLLHINGKPPALSIFPLTNRPSIDLPLIGREADLQWLQATKRNGLLIGQPGSGKTFLVSHFARQGNALFVVDDDRSAIADELRRQEPHVLIVDDAHLRPELLSVLRHMKVELGAAF